MESVIAIENLTRDYGNGKGVFHVNIEVRKGEVFGFLGPNGAGKTTTIRHLIGFIKAKEGSCKINGMDCFHKAPVIQASLGYLAGEISFLDDMKGMKLIDFIASMKKVTDRTRIEELMEMFELDPRGRIKKMSKGMKQKIGIICAFMNNPDVIILDEPTSGLDPLMQNRFIQLVLEEKKKGKTIFMSSHIFEEIEKTCDRTAIIRAGEIIAIEDMESLKKKKQKKYIVTFQDETEANRYAENENVEVLDRGEKEVTLKVASDVRGFLSILSKYQISDMDIERQSLEDIFLHYYGGDK